MPALRSRAALNGTYAPVVSVLKYGAVGDFNATTMVGTDSTAAFQSAITEIAAMGTTARAIISVPAGVFKVSAPLTGIPRNLRIVGPGKSAARICYTGTGIMFDLGTFAAVPSYLWEGSVSGFTIEGVWIDVPGTDYTSEGSRVPTCIRDCGNGSVTLRDTKISGFAYGFNGAYGSDFTVFDNADFSYNDVGAYFGPGAEQVSLSAGQFFGNREGLVLDRAPQGVVTGVAFIDSKVADIKAEYNAATVRSGAGQAASASMKNYNWDFKSCWFESNADGGGTRIPPQHVHTTGDTSGYPQYLKISDAYLVSGGTASATNAFWRNTNGTRHALDGLKVYGNQIKYAVDLVATGATFHMKNARQTDGWSGMVLWANGASTLSGLYEEPLTQTGKHGRATTQPLDRLRVIGDAVARLTRYADGKHEWSDGTAAADTNLYRASADLLVTDDAFKAVSLAVTGLTGAVNPGRFVGVTAVSPPTTGTFAVGDFIISQVGNMFVCTAAGTPGTWLLANSAGFDSDLAAGETVLPRFGGQKDNVAGIASGALLLTCFTARKSETITRVRMGSATTAAAATPTLCRIGVWTLDAADNGTALVGSHANDTALFAAASTPYTKTLTTPFNKIAGQRYAVGVLVVSAAAVPSYTGNIAVFNNAVTNLGDIPAVNFWYSAQADLPATFTRASAQGPSSRCIQAELLL